MPFPVLGCSGPVVRDGLSRRRSVACVTNTICAEGPARVRVLSPTQGFDEDTKLVTSHISSLLVAKNWVRRSK